MFFVFKLYSFCCTLQ